MVEGLILDKIHYRQALSDAKKRIDREAQARAKVEKGAVAERLERDFAIRVVKARATGLPLKRIQDEVLRTKSWSAWTRLRDLAREAGHHVYG